MKSHNAIFFTDFKNAYIPDILEEIYLKKIYDPYVIGKKDLIIADVGGNIGLTTYFFKDYAKQVYIVEPAKEHQETIKKMLEFNKISNVTLCPYAISNKNGTTKFYHNQNTTMFSLSNMMTESLGYTDFEEVETVSFDEFMKRNKLTYIDILKLDPEGEEAKILSSEGFAKYADKIKVIVGEWHNWAAVERNQFANIFKDLGYDFRWIPGTKAACYAAVRI